MKPPLSSARALAEYGYYDKYFVLQSRAQATVRQERCSLAAFAFRILQCMMLRNVCRAIAVVIVGIPVAWLSAAESAKKLADYQTMPRDAILTSLANDNGGVVMTSVYVVLGLTVIYFATNGVAFVLEMVARRLASPPAD